VEDASSKDATEVGCGGWGVVVDSSDSSCYTPKWAVREHEIFEIVDRGLPLEGIAVPSAS